MRRIPLLITALVMLSVHPLDVGAQTSDVRGLPEGTLFYSACLEGQGRVYASCTTSPEPVGGETEVPPEIFALTHGGTTQITSNELYEFRKAVWSPSGNLVGLSVGPDYEACRAWIVDKRDGSARPISPERDLTCATVQGWSRDGEWILLTVYWHDGPENLYKVRPDGTDLTELTHLDDDGDYVLEAAFIRRGKEIVYWGDRRNASGIFVMDNKGNHLRTLAREDWDRRIRINGFSLSPNHRRIAYLMEGRPNRPRPNEAFVMNVDGTNRKRLTHNQVHETALSWGPGRRIAFTAVGNRYEAGSGMKVRILDLASDEVVGVPVRDGTASPYVNPIWSPSGDHIALTVEDGLGHYAAYVANSRTGRGYLVTDFDHPFLLFSWRP